MKEFLDWRDTLIFSMKSLVHQMMECPTKKLSDKQDLWKETKILVPQESLHSSAPQRRQVQWQLNVLHVANTSWIRRNSLTTLTTIISRSRCSPQLLLSPLYLSRIPMPVVLQGFLSLVQRVGSITAGCVGSKETVQRTYSNMSERPSTLIMMISKKNALLVEVFSKILWL